MPLLNAQFANHSCKKLYSEKINKRGRVGLIFFTHVSHMLSFDRTITDAMKVRSKRLFIT